MATDPKKQPVRGDDCVRAARLSDVPALGQLINSFAQRRLMLSRSSSELYETIRDFLVIEGADGAIDGCAAVHVVSASIAELKSLAVADQAQGQGYGRILVESAVSAARCLGLQRLFALTYQVEFFTRLGFSVVDRAHLPEKVWGECVRCAQFLHCDETAMWRHL